MKSDLADLTVPPQLSQTHCQLRRTREARSNEQFSRDSTRNYRSCAGRQSTTCRSGRALPCQKLGLR